jgi:peptidoglycan/LPS O-acetylase OafA/YrhL
MIKEKLYFNNLNGLRFFAALMVIICHIELKKKYFLLPNLREILRHLGELGVDLFFVLSGFLITILLLKEKEICKEISYKKFYLRRVLRIWPLYYFIILLSLFVLPHISYFNQGRLELFSSNDLIKVVILFVLMLPNVLYIIRSIPFAGQTWSIGTEEQFYLVWPLIVNKLSNHKLVFLSCIVGYWIIYRFINLNFFNDVPYFSLFKSYYKLLKFDVLSVGALGAALFYEGHKRISNLNNIYVFIFSIIASILLYIYMPNTYEFFRLIYAILFIIIILNLVGNRKIENIFENKIINYLGQISYGIYMYHQIIIVFVLKMVSEYFNQFNLFENILVYIGTILLTIVISHISYEYFEKPILKYKSRFSPFINEK